MTPASTSRALPVQRTDEDVARYVNAFETFAREIPAAGPPGRLATRSRG